MTVPIDRPATADGLFLWVMHRFAEVYADRAILKGGMALRLIDSPRATTDIDYVFAPFSSKKEILEQVEVTLCELEGAEVEIELHSKMLRAELRVDAVAIQLEISVAAECSSEPMSTGSFARELGQPARVVRIMSPGWAFAHKLAAWNERRLLRDLYDCAFFRSRLGVEPAPEVLDQRLARVDSRLPKLKQRRSMTKTELATELRQEAEELDPDRVRAELGGLLPEEEIAGLSTRLKAAARGIADWLERD